MLFLASHVNYAFINWESASKSCLKSVSQNLNKAVRIMNFDKNTARSEPNVHKFGILNFDDSNALQCAKFMYDINA